MNRLLEIKKRKEEIRKALLGNEEIDLEKCKMNLMNLMRKKSKSEDVKQWQKKLNTGKESGNVIKYAEQRNSVIPFETRTDKTFEPENMSQEEIASSAEFRSGWLKRLKNAEAVLTETEQRAITTVNNAAVILHKL